MKFAVIAPTTVFALALANLGFAAEMKTIKFCFRTGWVDLGYIYVFTAMRGDLLTGWGDSPGTINLIAKMRNFRTACVELLVRILWRRLGASKVVMVCSRHRDVQFVINVSFTDMRVGFSVVPGLRFKALPGG